MGMDELKRWTSGGRARFVKPVGLGEIGIVHTQSGWVEARDAVRRNLGGEVVARVSS